MGAVFPLGTCKSVAGVGRGELKQKHDSEGKAETSGVTDAVQQHETLLCSGWGLCGGACSCPTDSYDPSECTAKYPNTKR